MFFLCKKVISVSLEAPVSLLTQLLKVEECVHGTGAMCTSVVTPLSVVMKVEESVQCMDSSNVYISGNTIFSQGLKSGGNTAHFCSD